jgi:hypothetical protein
MVVRPMTHSKLLPMAAPKPASTVIAFPFAVQCAGQLDDEECAGCRRTQDALRWAVERLTNYELEELRRFLSFRAPCSSETIFNAGSSAACVEVS